MSDFLPHPFWNFSLEIYAGEGVAEACLDLQARRGCDVNILLFCCWLGASGRPTLTAERLGAILKVSDVWQAEIVRLRLRQPVKQAFRELYVLTPAERAAGDASPRFAGHLVNPTFEAVGDEEQFGPEGCLSIPGMSWDCRRHLHVVAHGFDMYGEPLTVEGTETLARCIQHEIDHLDGVLMLDRTARDQRKAALRALREGGSYSPTAEEPADEDPAPAATS